MTSINPAKRMSVLLMSLGLSSMAWHANASNIESQFVMAGNTVLKTQTIVQQVIQNNAQIIYADIQRRIAAEKIVFEQGIYETEFFSNLNYDDAHLQRSAGEKLSAALNAQNKQILNESNTNLTLGLRRLISTGGEVTLSYLAQEKNNNIIPENVDSSIRDSEFTTAVNIELTQPLLRGMGNPAVETRIRRATIEQDVVEAQYRQQMLKLVSEALSAYWQLYKTTRFLTIREASLVNAQNTLVDIERKVRTGKEPESSIFDAKSAVLKRKVALDSAKQARNEALYQVSTLMNIAPDDAKGLVYQLGSRPDTSEFILAAPFETYYETVLLEWPNFLVLDRNIAIQEQEIELANDELRPKLDLKLGYKSNDLNKEFSGDRVFDNEYPSWYVGLNFSMPIGGNDRIQAKKSMAVLKQDQQLEDLNAVKIGLRNDLRAKLFQVDMAYQELQSLAENVTLLEELFRLEKQKFDLGYGQLVDFYGREDSLNLERQRLIDGEIKYELAKVSLALADGTLLKDYFLQN